MSCKRSSEELNESFGGAVKKGNVFRSGGLGIDSIVKIVWLRFDRHIWGGGCKARDFMVSIVKSLKHFPDD